MDHSEQGYLRRQSAEVLKAFLEVCLHDKESYGYIIPEILAILEDKVSQLPKKNDPGR